MLLLRRVVFTVLAVIYLITCPMVILYALGYLVKTGTDPSLVSTGLISISTVPSGASVYLGNRRYTHATPTVLRSLLSGTYDVRVTLKGRQAWQRSVEVKPARATVLDQVLLIPDHWTLESLTERPFEDIVPFPGREFLLLKRGTRLEGAELYDWKARKSWPLVSPGSGLEDARLLAQTVMPNGGSLLMRVHAHDRERFLWVEARHRKEPAVTDLTKLFVVKPQKVLWDPSDRHMLFSLRDGTIGRIDTADESVSPGFMENVRSFAVFNRKVIVLLQDGTLLRTDAENKNPELIRQGEAVSRLLEGETGRVLIHPVTDEWVLLLTDRGQLIANRFPFLIADEGVAGLTINTRRDKVLLWTPTRLGVLDLSAESEGTGGRSSLKDVHWIAVAGQNLQQAWWVHEGRNALIRDQDRISLVRVDGQTVPEVRDVIRVKRDSAAWYAESTGTLFYLDAETGRLTALELLPRWELPGLSRPDMSESAETEESAK